MEFVLAYADVGDSGVGNLTFVVEAVGIIVGVAVFVLFVWGIARFRQHRRAEAITAIAILWGVITAVSVIYAVDSQMKWNEEHTLQLETGYLDAGNEKGRPEVPWGLWAGLGVGYVGILGWSISGRPPISSIR